MAFHSLKCMKQIRFNDIHALILAENADAKLQIILSNSVAYITDIKNHTAARPICLISFSHIIKY